MLFSNCTVVDNWSLQVISTVLTDGFDGDESSALVVDRSTDTHFFKAVPSDAIALEALFDLVADIVLRDELWFDEDYSDAWRDRQHVFQPLIDTGVLKSFRFSSQAQEFQRRRNIFVDQLCSTTSLKAQHAENVAGWETHKSSPHRYLGQLIWGGAGMFARAVAHDVFYTPHPARRRMLESSDLFFSVDDAAVILKEFIDDKLASLRVMNKGAGQRFSMKINMPAFAALVIREANDPTDFIKIALQLRTEYATLRAWISEYQAALKVESAEGAERFRDLLNSVSKYVDARLGKSSSSAATFTVDLSFLKLALRGDPFNTAANHIGVRSQINRLIFGGPRHRDLDLLLRKFRETQTTAGLRVKQHFVSA